MRARAGAAVSIGMMMTNIVVFVLEKEGIGRPVPSFEQDLNVPKTRASHAAIPRGYLRA